LGSVTHSAPVAPFASSSDPFLESDPVPIALFALVFTALLDVVPIFFSLVDAASFSLPVDVQAVAFLFSSEQVHHPVWIVDFV
jgi:hypothetical protein